MFSGTRGRAVRDDGRRFGRDELWRRRYSCDGGRSDNRRRGGRSNRSGWLCRRRAGPQQCVNTRNCCASLRDATPVCDRLSHASQLIEARLDQIEHRVVGGNGPHVDREHERFQLMAEVAHGRNARHAGAALECVQRPLQGRPVVGTRGIRTPIRQRLFGRVDELERFLSEDGRDFRIVVAAVLGEFFDRFRGNTFCAWRGRRRRCSRHGPVRRCTHRARHLRQSGL